MNAALEQVSRFLEEKELQFAFAGEGESILLPCTGEKLQWNTVINVSESGNCISFVSRLPAKVPPPRRRAAAEAIAKLNFGRRLGAFQIDLGDGEVLYCASQVLDDEPLTDDVLDMLLAVSYLSMDSSGPDVLSLIFGSEPAEGTPTNDLSRSVPSAWN